MRREWSGWIKTKNWVELERLARSEPSQDLADTVGELERGFPEKADRKALRRVLFFLNNAGYRPTPLDLPEIAPAPVDAPFRFGFLVSPDGKGDAVVTYAVGSGRKVRWLSAHVHGRLGVTDATEEEYGPEDSVKRAAALRASNPRPFACAEIEPDLALALLADAVKRTTRMMPPVVASWRSMLDAVPALTHPAALLPREETEPRVGRRVPMMMDATLLWRLELGLAAPVLRELAELPTDEMDDETRAASTEALLAKARAVAFTPEIVRDHADRLRHLGLILHLKGEPESGILLNALDDLVERGPESDYAIGMMDKTIVLLYETLRPKQDDSSKRI